MSENNLELNAPVSRLLDLGVFFKTLQLLFVEEKAATSPEIKRELGDLLREANTLAKLQVEDFNTDVETHLSPVFNIHGYKSFKHKWESRIGRPNARPLLNAARGEWVTGLLAKMRRKQGIFNDTFGTGLVLQTAKKLANVDAGASSIEQAQLLLDCRFTGSATRTRRFCKRALVVLGAIQSDLDEAAADISYAKNLGGQLQATEATLARTDPLNEVRTEALEGAAETLRQKITDVAMESSTPAAVMQVAAEASAASSRNFATRTGEKFGLSAEQEAAMMGRGKVLVAATAGSGKTATLTAKVNYHINELDMAPSSIMATSFSSKSAYELMERIRKSGGESFMSDRDVLDGFGTTHSVSGKLLDKYANRGYGKVPALNGGQQSMLIKQAIAQVQLRPEERPGGHGPLSFFEAAQAEAAAPPSSEAEEFSEDFVVPAADDWEASLKLVIRFHTENPHIPYANLAVSLAKSILSRGLTKGQLSNKQRFAINKAFERSEQSIRAGLVTLEDLRDDDDDIKATPISAAGRSSYWQEPANQWFNIGEEEAFNGKRPLTPKDVQLAIGNWKANLITPDAAWAEGGGVPAACYAAYEWLKANDDAAPAKRDHDDVLIESCQLLVKDPSVLGSLQARYKCVIVDEGQDLNKAQHLLFGLIAGEIDPSTLEKKEDGQMTADTYAIIGDPNQAIYGFRGADADLFIDRNKEFGGDFDTYSISMNFRSGSAIVDAANRLSERFGKSIPMTCTANKEKRGIGHIEAVQVDEQRDEGYIVAEQIKELIDSGDGFSPSDFGVCLRTNAEAYSYCMELLRRGVPFRSKTSFFNDPTSKSLILWLRLAEAGENDTATINEVVLGAYNTPRFGLDARFGQRMQQVARGDNYLKFLADGGWRDVYEQNWRNEKAVRPYMEALLDIQGAKGSPTDILDRILNMKGASVIAKNQPQSFKEALVEKTMADPEQREALITESTTGEVDEGSAAALALAPIDPLMGVLELYDDLSPAMRYVEELQDANRRTSKKDRPDKANQEDTEYNAPAVMVDTVHQWKGLEAPHVYVAMSENTFPHINSKGDDAAMEAERRLAYVAITRGRDSVTVVSHHESARKKPGGVSSFTMEACIPLSDDIVTEEGSPLAIADGSEPDEGELLDAFILDAKVDGMIFHHHFDEVNLSGQEILASLKRIGKDK